MKRLILAVAGLLIFTLMQAQSLDEIVKKYTVANKLDKVSGLSTIKVTAKMSMMGMEIPMETWMKNPNKTKIVSSMAGQEVIQVFDGEKGFNISPMGSVEMKPEQVKETLRSNFFLNYLADYLKNGKLTLESEESINGKPAFKIKIDIDGGNLMYLFIDKGSYLVQKMSINVSQGGKTITVDSYPTDYKETNGVLVPMKTTSSASGMEFSITIEKVEVNIPMDDNIFKVK
jgi:outer membrane lipoprotein-sorting protein